MQRKHEGVERDLAALEDKVMTLGQEAARLCGIHPNHGDQIKAKHQEIENNWERLTGKAKVTFVQFEIQSKFGNVFDILSHLIFL